MFYFGQSLSFLSLSTSFLVRRSASSLANCFSSSPCSRCASFPGYLVIPSFPFFSTFILVNSLCSISLNLLSTLAGLRLEGCWHFQNTLLKLVFLKSWYCFIPKGLCASTVLWGPIDFSFQLYYRHTGNENGSLNFALVIVRFFFSWKPILSGWVGGRTDGDFYPI